MIPGTYERIYWYILLSLLVDRWKLGARAVGIFASLHLKNSHFALVGDRDVLTGEKFGGSFPGSVGDSGL